MCQASSEFVWVFKPPFEQQHFNSGLVIKLRVGQINSELTVNYDLVLTVFRATGPRWLPGVPVSVISTCDKMRSSLSRRGYVVACLWFEWTNHKRGWNITVASVSGRVRPRTNGKAKGWVSFEFSRLSLVVLASRKIYVQWNLFTYAGMAVLLGLRPLFCGKGAICWATCVPGTCRVTSLSIF